MGEESLLASLCSRDTGGNLWRGLISVKAGESASTSLA